MTLVALSPVNSSAPDQPLLSPQMVSLLVRLGGVTTRLEKIVEHLVAMTDEDE